MVACVPRIVFTSNLQHQRSDVALDPIALKYSCAASRYLEVDGTSIHYCMEGSGPTLVLLHGIVASLHTWDGWVKALGAHYRILRLDLPGFGLSEPLAHDKYTPEYTVKLFERIRIQLGIESFYLAGNSLGGFLSWYYAAAQPKRVEKLILIDPIAYSQRLPLAIGLVTLPLVGEIARFLSPRFIVERNVRGVFGNPHWVSSELVDRYHELLARGENRLAMLRVLRQIKRYNKDPAFTVPIRGIRCPTLLMWGERDRWVPPALIELWKRDLPDASVKLYAGVGHVPMEEIPVQTALDAHRFLSGESS